MKILTTSVFLLIAVAILAACGSPATEPEIVPNQQDETEDYISAYDAITYNQNTSDYDEPGSYDDNEADAAHTLAFGFTLIYNSVTIQMDQDMAYLLTLLGEPLGIFEAPSCAFDGIDRIFGFPGIQIHTYPDGDLDRVHTISFLDDSITTSEGITLGNSLDDVLAAYGSNYEQDTNMFTFTIDRTTLSFFIEDDMVTGIIYGLIMY
ncbi:MAG: hypothetical protein FWC92_00855 [Defluviitaleaceae bacterium]|nr:hypothetical protein [Defluviitaleaceae bacterium]